MSSPPLEACRDSTWGEGCLEGLTPGGRGGPSQLSHSGSLKSPLGTQDCKVEINRLRGHWCPARQPRRSVWPPGSSEAPSFPGPRAGGDLGRAGRRCSGARPVPAPLGRRGCGAFPSRPLGRAPSRPWWRPCSRPALTAGRGQAVPVATHCTQRPLSPREGATVGVASVVTPHETG